MTKKRTSWTREDFVELVGVKEISERYEVTAMTVHNWMTDYPSFPEPVARVSGGRIPVYLWEEVVKWKADRELGKVRSRRWKK
jgi:hypothetical protein